MSDHLDTPDLNPPNMDARVDICDFYIFQKPGDANKSVIILDVNPLAPTFADSFSDEAVYEIKVDTNADAVAEIAYRFTFTPKTDGEQRATVRRASGIHARGASDEGEILFHNVPVSFGEEAMIAHAGEYSFFAGIRSDPFFFDLGGFQNGMNFTGEDTFLDKNVFSIALELPNSALGHHSRVGLWSRVLIPKDGNPFFQIDRTGRPFISIPFTQGEDRNTFNRIEPTHDREIFLDKFADRLVSSGMSFENAQKVALTLLPDILDYDYSRADGYRNGRNLTDDIIDIQLAIITNGAVTEDKVGPHKDLLSVFPYVGPPHPISK